MWHQGFADVTADQFTGHCGLSDSVSSTVRARKRKYSATLPE